MESPDADDAITLRYLVGTSLDATARNAGSLVLCALLGVLPGTLVGLAEAQMPSRGFASLPVFLVSALFAQACITHIVSSDVTGRAHGGVPEALGVAASRMPTLIAVCAVVWPVVAIGVVLLVVPGLLFWVMWFVAVQIATVEQRGPIDTLRRSAEFTRVGFGALFVSVLAILVSYGVAQFCFTTGTLLVFVGVDQLSGLQLATVAYGVASKGLVLVALSTLATVFYVRAAERMGQQKVLVF